MSLFGAPLLVCERFLKVAVIWTSPEEDCHLGDSFAVRQISVGSIRRKQIVWRIPDEKWLLLLIKKYFWPVQYATAYQPGPATPPSGDVQYSITSSVSTYHEASCKLTVSLLSCYYIEHKIKELFWIR